MNSSSIQINPLGGQKRVEQPEISATLGAAGGQRRNPIRRSEKKDEK
jgi:hypothetical protein